MIWLWTQPLIKLCWVILMIYPLCREGSPPGFSEKGINSMSQQKDLMGNLMTLKLNMYLVYVRFSSTWLNFLVDVSRCFRFAGTQDLQKTADRNGFIFTVKKGSHLMIFYSGPVLPRTGTICVLNVIQLMSENSSIVDQTHIIQYGMKLMFHVKHVTAPVQSILIGPAIWNREVVPMPMQIWDLLSGLKTMIMLHGFLTRIPVSQNVLYQGKM